MEDGSRIFRDNFLSPLGFEPTFLCIARTYTHHLIIYHHLYPSLAGLYPSLRYTPEFPSLGYSAGIALFIPYSACAGIARRAAIDDTYF